MDDKKPSTEGNINFRSTDIKKNDLNFNVQEKKSVKLQAQLHQFGQKVSTHPLFRGKNKFFTIGIAVVVIAAAIALPIVLPKLLTPAPTPEEILEEVDQTMSDTADAVKNLDPDAPEDTREAVLSDLDRKIDLAPTDESRYFFVSAKYVALLKYGRYEEAIATRESVIGMLIDHEYWDALTDSYEGISDAYTAMGDKESAIAWMQKAVDLYTEIANDPTHPPIPSGRAYYEKRLAELKNS